MLASTKTGTTRLEGNFSFFSHASYRFNKSRICVRYISTCLYTSISSTDVLAGNGEEESDLSPAVHDVILVLFSFDDKRLILKR